MTVKIARNALFAFDAEIAQAMQLTWIGNTTDFIFSGPLSESISESNLAKAAEKHVFKWSRGRQIDRYTAYFENRMVFSKGAQMIPGLGSIVAIMGTYGYGRFLREVARHDDRLRNVSVTARGQVLARLWEPLEPQLWDAGQAVALLERHTAVRISSAARRSITEISSDGYRWYKANITSNPGAQRLSQEVAECVDEAKGLFSDIKSKLWG